MAEEKKTNLAESLIERYILYLYKKENDLPIDKSMTSEVIDLLGIRPEVKKLSRMLKICCFLFIAFLLIAILVAVLVLAFVK